MSEHTIELYLNDHLAGAMLGTELAAQIRDRSEGTRLGDLMTTIAREIEEDRDTLLELMERLDVRRNPVKQAAGWVAEKASRVKFSAVTPGGAEQGIFMALESLTLGVEGKRSLWKALQGVASDSPPLASTDLGRLIDRATEQHDALERERMALARSLLGRSAPPPAGR
jgi:hypothetical protein